MYYFTISKTNELQIRTFLVIYLGQYYFSNGYIDEWVDQQILQKKFLTIKVYTYISSLPFISVLLLWLKIIYDKNYLWIFLLYFVKRKILSTVHLFLAFSYFRNKFQVLKQQSNNNTFFIRYEINIFYLLNSDVLIFI